MGTSIILSIALCLTISLTSAQLPNYSQANTGRPLSSWSSGASQPSWSSAPTNSWSSGSQASPWASGSPSAWSRASLPSSPSYSQYQPYRAPAAASLSSPTLGQYNRFPSAPQQSSWASPQSGAWSSSAPQSGAWSAPAPQSGAWSAPAPQSGAWSAPQSSSWASPQSGAWSSPALQSGAWSAPQSPSWASAANRMPAYPQSSGAYAGSPRSPGSQLATYSRPAPVAQPQYQGSPYQWQSNINHHAAQASAPALPQQQYSAPSSPQTYSPPAQAWSAPSTSQWSPPAQQYTAPAATPVAAPQAPTQSYTSPQNAQNIKPAPVHYANIGADLQGDYKFGYHTGDGGSFREETRLPDGTVQGAYGFVDADGKQRIVKYSAGKNGFQAEGDDVPKGTPVAAPSGQPQAQAQPAQALNFDEGAAYKSFSQG